MMVLAGVGKRRLRSVGNGKDAGVLAREVSREIRGARWICWAPTEVIWKTVANNGSTIAFDNQFIVDSFILFKYLV